MSRYETRDDAGLVLVLIIAIVVIFGLLVAVTLLPWGSAS